MVVRFVCLASAWACCRLAPPSNANVTALCRKLWVVSLSLSSPAARRASFAICRMLRVDSGFPYVLLERLANSGESPPPDDLALLAPARCQVVVNGS